MATSKKAPENKTSSVPKQGQPHYEEWKCEIRVRQVSKDENVIEFEKLKMIRPRVLISSEQAEILNNGVLHGANSYALMYFLPE